MTIIDDSSYLIQPKTNNGLPVVSIPVRHIGIKPTIKYEKHIINEANVDDFLRNRSSAFYCADTKTITMISYSISNTIKEPRYSEAKQIAQEIEKERPNALVHETQHFYNHLLIPSFQDFCSMNYYQEISLKCLDEISAITAGILYTKPEYTAKGVNQATVMCSMLESTYMFINYCFDVYVGRFTNNILQHRKTPAESFAYLQRLQETYKTNPNVLFDKNFHDTVKQFFVFDDYCILDDKITQPAAITVWNVIKNNFAQIKQKSMIETSKMIDRIINQK